MTTLPTPSGWPDPILPAPSAALGNCDPERPDPDDEEFLLRAFRSFAQAAGSLERSYGLLREEVARLRHELEQANRDLVESLDENRRMRAYLDRVLEGLPCGVLVVSSADEISRANPEAVRLLGIGPVEQSRVGAADQVRALASVSSLPSAIRSVLEQARRSEGEQEIALAQAKPAGAFPAAEWVAVRHALMTDGTHPSSIFILHDVSARKQLEEAESRLRREQALAEMSAVLAHEIRNPLGSLELFAGLLAESDLDRERKEWVGQLQAGLRTLAATVNNVLHFHSLPEPQRSPVDLGELIDWARDFFAPLARQSRIALSTQNRLRGVSLAVDRHRLEQVLLNLTLNAVHAMPAGGWIEIGGRVGTDGSVLITVADTGPGISPEHLPEIFAPRFSTRADSPGLGLTVCRRIVEQHGGRITAASPAGRGAVFSLIFPSLISPSSVFPSLIPPGSVFPSLIPPGSVFPTSTSLALTLPLSAALAAEPKASTAASAAEGGAA